MDHTIIMGALGAAFTGLSWVVWRLHQTVRKLETGIAIASEIVGALHTFVEAVAECPSQSCPTKSLAGRMSARLEKLKSNLDKALSKPFNPKTL